MTPITEAPRSRAPPSHRAIPTRSCRSASREHRTEWKTARSGHASGAARSAPSPHGTSALSSAGPVASTPDGSAHFGTLLFGPPPSLIDLSLSPSPVLAVTVSVRS